MKINKGQLNKTLRLDDPSLEHNYETLGGLLTSETRSNHSLKR